jgi:tetratricopeptide (TPR) repeat protein
LTRTKDKEPEKVKKSTALSFSQYLAIGAIVFSLFIILYSLFKFWYADTLFAKGKKLNEVNQYNQAFGELQAAVQLNSSEPFYHDELAQAAASLAVAAHQQEEASLSAELTTLAIAESDQALKISPRHLNFWKNRTRVFYTLAEIDENYYQEALSSLLKAVEIAPTDAKVFYNLAVLYGRLDQNQTAIETLEKTIQLKPNYEAARWALALFYEQEGNLEKAKEELNYILEKINPNNQTVKEKLEEL